ncbi:hypothetical protein [Nocardia terpenica]|uniref:hypothetical protein n=1 Tax=Nocardia terpenica TaxID=455432 RepID=UPI001E4E03F4|nr:hypothetical protein [Nocardia terpenica]
MVTDGDEGTGADKKKSETVLWTVAVVLLIQGFGSGVTELLWRHSFGVSGILIHVGAPTWTSWVIGVVGLAVGVWAAVVESRAKA